MRDSDGAGDLAVIIPTRDRWEILDLTLRALRNQTVGGFEVVVVVDGRDQAIPDLGPATVVAIDKAGPGAARNAGVARTDRPLILFLGDDTVPDPGLVERHLARHRVDPAEQIAVLGDISWHADVAESRIHRWLDWSGTQFDYRRLRHDRPADAGWGRFIASNTSLKRTLFEAAGGFDEAFAYFCEDLDLGYRLARLGMVLRYEPRAEARHIHAYDWTSVERRFAAIASGERRMAAKHPAFRPHFQALLEAAAAAHPVSRVWTRLVDRLPDDGSRWRTAVERKANRWYHQQLAPAFRRGWEIDEELEELEAYAAVAGLDRPVVDRLASKAGTVAGRNCRDQLARLLGPHGSLLDLHGGLGADGLRLLAAGYRVAFAPVDPAVAAYLSWRLTRRGLHVPILDAASGLPGGFDVAAILGGFHEEADPWASLCVLEGQAPTVVVVDGRACARLLAHARERGVVRYRRYGERDFIAYRGLQPPTVPPQIAAVGSVAALRSGQILARWPGLAGLKWVVARACDATGHHRRSRR